MRKYSKKRLFTFVSFPGEDKYASCAAKIIHECAKRFLEEFHDNLYEDAKSAIKCIEEKREQEDCNAPIISDYVKMLKDIGDNLIIEEHLIIEEQNGHDV